MGNIREHKLGPLLNYRFGGLYPSVVFQVLVHCHSGYKIERWGQGGPSFITGAMPVGSEAARAANVQFGVVSRQVVVNKSSLVIDSISWRDGNILCCGSIQIDRHGWGCYKSDAQRQEENDLKWVAHVVTRKRRVLIQRMNERCYSGQAERRLFDEGLKERTSMCSKKIVAWFWRGA